jgi:hypothetical protein
VEDGNVKDYVMKKITILMFGVKPVINKFIKEANDHIIALLIEEEDGEPCILTPISS